MKAIFAAALLLSAAIPAHAVETSGNASVCFTLHGEDCAMVAVGEIAKAQRTLDMQTYSFTEPHIAAALVAAKQRGVAVRIIADKTDPSERGGELVPVAQTGILAWIDYEPRIAHNKVMVIDGMTTLTGSFNWTASADHANAENLLVIHDPVLAGFYEQNFQFRLQASESLQDYQAGHGR